MSLEYRPLMVEAGEAFPGYLIVDAMQCGRHLAVTVADGTSACVCGVRWSVPQVDPELRRAALRMHVERI